MMPRLIVQTAHRSGWHRSLIRLSAIVLALLISAAFLELTGKSPLKVFGTMFTGAFGSKFGFSETLVRSVPLLLCGLGIALASKMQLWNIGAEGQFHMGAFAASGLALKFPDWPAVALLPAMMLAAVVAGGLWAFLPGLARAYLGTNETITTLLLNYVAINWVLYLVYGPWKDPKGFNFPLTAQFSDSASLPIMWGRVHVGLILALVIAGALWFVLQRSKWGYEIRVIGESPKAAAYAGMSITRNILLVMFVAGGLAGLAGMFEVSGLIHRLQKDISPGYGYSAIIIAYLAQLNPVALIFVSFLFGGLQAGGYSVQSLGVPLATAQMIQGAILFCVLGAEMFTRNKVTIQWRSSAAKEVA